jgi:hypothetical protein
MHRNIGETPETGFVLTATDALGKMESGSSREPKDLASFLPSAISKQRSALVMHLETMSFG